MGTPLIVGTLFGVRTLAGVLAGALVSGVQMAVSMSNTGGRQGGGGSERQGGRPAAGRAWPPCAAAPRAPAISPPHLHVARPLCMPPGGAWDNAKKYIEAGASEHARELGGKGSDCHKARGAPGRGAGAPGCWDARRASCASCAARVGPAAIRGARSSLPTAPTHRPRRAGRGHRRHGRRPAQGHLRPLPQHPHQAHGCGVAGARRLPGCRPGAGSAADAATPPPSQALGPLCAACSADLAPPADLQTWRRAPRQLPA